MTITTFMLLLFIPSPDVQGLADLFEVLDQNSDGKVTANEISDAQRPYFQRSLRVADHNEDGALTRAELTTALTDPQRVEIKTAAGRGNFDPTVFDRNKDGYISKDEVPAALQERFKRGFEQYGDRIPVTILQNLRGRSSAKPKSPEVPMAGMSETMQQRVQLQQAQLSAAVKRLDANKDGILSSDELKNSDSRMTALDRNRDGQLSRIELAVAMRSMGNQVSNTEQRPTATTPDQLFRRLDANSDGQLTAVEIPQRMRQMVRRADQDEDGVISTEEFRSAIERQSQGR